MEDFESQHMLSKSFHYIIMSRDLLCIEYDSIEYSIAARILQVNRGTTGASMVHTKHVVGKSGGMTSNLCNIS